MSTAEKILHLRKNAGISQEKLAEMLNMSRQTISKWESGASRPDAEALIALGEIFNISIDALLKDEINISSLEASTISNIDITLSDTIAEAERKENTIPRYSSPSNGTQAQAKINKTPKKHNPVTIITVAIIVLSVIVGAVFLLLTRKEKLSAEDLAVHSKSVVMLECYDIDNNLFATGSGFIAYEDDVVITNYHVIEGNAYSINVLSENGNNMRVTHIIAYDEELDIAILKLAHSSGLTPLVLGTADDLLKGETIFAIGSPLGLFMNSVSSGIISGFLQDGVGTIQFTASISHGSSGGALFNQSGEVIGITYASVEEGQNLNFAIPIYLVDHLWETADTSNTLTVKEFYNLFEHIMSFEYVLSHKEELNGSEILFSAYVSSVGTWVNPEYGAAAYYYLVGTEDDVVGGIFDGNETSQNIKYAFELDRQKQLLSIKISVLELSNTHTLCINPVLPGNKIVLRGILDYTNEYHDDYYPAPPGWVRSLNLREVELVE